MLHVVQATSQQEVEQVRALLNEYVAWFQSFANGQPNLADDVEFDGHREEFANLPGIYAPPDGRLLLALNDGQAAGCVALKRIDNFEGEKRRLEPRRKGCACVCTRILA